jgi:hypothetical protein
VIRTDDAPIGSDPSATDAEAAAAH